jgi:O-antigen ligase
MNNKIPASGIPIGTQRKQFYRQSSSKTESNAEVLFSVYLSAIILSSYFAYSFRTAAGFVSLADVIIGAALIFYLAVYLYKSHLDTPNIKVVIFSLIAFCLISISTKVVNSGLEISPIVKYGVFLILIPLTFWLSGNSSPSSQLYQRVLSLYTNCGNLLLGYVITCLLLGFHSGVGDNFQINLFDQPIYKNQIGEFLIYISSANLISFGLKKKLIYLILFFATIVCCIFLDVRGPIVAALVMSVIIYIKLFKINAHELLRFAGISCALVLTIYIVYLSGLLDKQFDRLIHFADTSTINHKNISSSASRLILWQYAAGLVAQFPFFGVGYGGFFYDQTRGWLYGMNAPHNNILQIMSEGGLIGFGAFALLLIFGLTNKINDRYALSVKLIAVSYLVTTLVDIVWVRGTGHLFWILFYLVALYRNGGALRRRRERRA